MKRARGSAASDSSRTSQLALKKRPKTSAAPKKNGPKVRKRRQVHSSSSESYSEDGRSNYSDTSDEESFGEETHDDKIVRKVNVCNLSEDDSSSSDESTSKKPTIVNKTLNDDQIKTEEPEKTVEEPFGPSIRSFEFLS